MLFVLFRFGGIPRRAAKLEAKIKAIADKKAEDISKGATETKKSQ